jgi:DNA-binding transcriptional LysR family regulator
MGVPPDEDQHVQPHHPTTQVRVDLAIAVSTIGKLSPNVPSIPTRKIVHMTSGRRSTYRAACEQAAAYFSGSRPRGRLRIGISDDLALTRLPQILRDFRRDNPLVDFDLRVDQSGLLHQRLESDKLDVFIGKRPSGEQRGQLVKRDRLVWVGTPTTKLDLARPLPLVVYPAPSISRTEIRRALSRARLPFRSACICRGVNGLIAAVAAGIGISALAASLVPVQLTTLGPGHRLPELGTIDLVLLTNPRTDDRPAVRALISTVLASGSRSLTAYRDETVERPCVRP